MHAALAPPRAVRVLELGEDGAPIHNGLLVVEVGTRLVFSVKPNARIDLVRTHIMETSPLLAAPHPSRRL